LISWRRAATWRARRKITPLEGKSLAPAFGNRPIERDAIFFEHEGNKAVIAGKWKLVSKSPGPWELYDFERDRTETDNLAAKQPELVQQLARRWDAWAERCHVLPVDARSWDQRLGTKKER
jgi:arylsulfatase A-like enzyme